jgi:hypothetical protein
VLSSVTLARPKSVSKLLPWATSYSKFIDATKKVESGSALLGTDQTESCFSQVAGFYGHKKEKKETSVCAVGKE